MLNDAADLIPFASCFGFHTRRKMPDESYYACFTEKKIWRGEGQHLQDNSAMINVSQAKWPGLEAFQVLNLWLSRL